MSGGSTTSIFVPGAEHRREWTDPGSSCSRRNAMPRLFKWFGSENRVFLPPSSPAEAARHRGRLSARRCDRHPRAFYVVIRSASPAAPARASRQHQTKPRVVPPPLDIADRSNVCSSTLSLCRVSRHLHVFRSLGKIAPIRAAFAHLAEPAAEPGRGRRNASALPVRVRGINAPAVFFNAARAHQRERIVGHRHSGATGASNPRSRRRDRRVAASAK